MARPRTSGLNRKLSVLYLSKAKKEYFLAQTHVLGPIELKNECYFFAHPRTSGLYRKLSVLYPQKDRDESMLSHTCLKKTTEFRNGCFFRIANALPVKTGKKMLFIHINWAN